MNPVTNAYGNSTVLLTVTDGDSATAQDSFVLTVNSVNDAPAGTNTTVTTNEDVQYIFTTVNF